MTTLTHTCEICDSNFTLKYDVNETDADPGFCPFCGEMLIEYEFDEDDED